MQKNEYCRSVILVEHVCSIIHRGAESTAFIAWLSFDKCKKKELINLQKKKRFTRAMHLFLKRYSQCVTSMWKPNVKQPLRLKSIMAEMNRKSFFCVCMQLYSTEPNTNSRAFCVSVCVCLCMFGFLYGHVRTSGLPDTEQPVTWIFSELLTSPSQVLP